MTPPDPPTDDVGSDGRSLAGRTVVFVVNVDWFFLSHRLPVALAARAAGARVVVATATTDAAPRIRDHGLELYPVAFTRSGIHVVEEARTVIALARLYRAERPDVIHHVTVKPVLYGGVVARLVSRRSAVVNAVTGLGFTFSAGGVPRWLGRLVRSLYRASLHHPRSRTIFQNPDDLERFVRERLVPRGRAILIRGSGVNVSSFGPGEDDDHGVPLIVLPARMLWDKGVGDLVEAAAILRERGCRARVALVGAPDAGNPRAVPVAQLRRWHGDGIVEWWGHRDDMPLVLASAAVVALPTTYPEGVPKSLLEAAAAARPIVATDVPGCREICVDGVTGLLVPPHDATALADALERLVADPGLRASLGAAGRDLVVREFSEEHVVSATLALYDDLLSSAS